MDICAKQGHEFPVLVGGTACERCGIIYCPVAYDHQEWMDYCAVCGWENEGGQ